MNDLLIYFVKVNIAIALFYVFYRLFFVRDTFWKIRRFYLLVSVMLSFAYPFFSIENWLQNQQPMQNMVINYVALQEITIYPNPPKETFSLLNIFVAIYFWVIAILFAKMILQLISIAKIRGKHTTVQGIKIISLDKKITPFSFFGVIYMNPALHSDKEMEQILTHELTHVREVHSFDVLIAEIVCIFFWINPFTWLLKREIRQNLEFLADNKVLESGFDSKSYQYHLLQLSYQSPEALLANKFNVSPLKKRITMMNQQKTSKMSILKYLLIIPLALALVVSSNAETIIKSAQDTISNKPVIKEQNSEKETSNIPEVKVIGYGKTQKKLPDAKIEKTPPVPPTPDMKDVPPPPPPLRKSKDVPPPPPSVPTTEGVTFTVVESMPEFPGGTEAMLKYLANNTKYPAKAHENGIQGRVICQFIVKSDGSIADVKAIRSVDPMLDAEAIRVIQSMPNWTPGKQRGKNVNVKYVLPINFNLYNNEESELKVNGIDPKNPPLIVIDGQIMPEGFNINAIRPESIAKVEVLKNGAATNVYGEKGKNGVILLTMKK